MFNFEQNVKQIKALKNCKIKTYKNQMILVKRQRVAERQIESIRNLANCKGYGTVYEICTELVKKMEAMLE